MLLLLFNVGPERYGLDSSRVIEVVPAVPLRSLPQAPDYVAGLFRYRGLIVPVIDLCALLGGRPADRLMSTRIILVDYPGPGGESRVLGLVAERVTDSLLVSEDELKPPGLSLPGAPYLAQIVDQPDGLTQCLAAGELLSGEVAAMLFPEEGSAS